MCYSAQVWSSYRRYLRKFDAKISIEEFIQLFELRLTDRRIKIAKGMEAAFLDDDHQDPGMQTIRDAIAKYQQSEATRLEQELFTQRKRFNDAERTLATKITKAATESKRIATDKIERITRQLSDLRRTELLDRDHRIYPGYYAPVMIVENDQLVIKPMRYQCRPAGKPAFYDTKYPGTYNARRDNLEGFWKKQFGTAHGVMMVDAFYENVDRHRVEGRELKPDEKPENVILQFKPQTNEPMLVACLWSRWSEPGQDDLLSFAAITDEPPAEVAASGHDRCIIPIQQNNLMAWLKPDCNNLAAQYAILDARERPYYEHRLAA